MPFYAVLHLADNVDADSFDDMDDDAFSDTVVDAEDAADASQAANAAEAAAPIARTSCGTTHEPSRFALSFRPLTWLSLLVVLHRRGCT